MKQLFLPILGASAFIILVGLLYNNKINLTGIKPATDNSSISTSQAKVNEVLIDIEVADNNDTRAKGLSGREKLDEGKGMLFVFEDKNIKPGFWMKGMIMPIDIIWINDGNIVQIDSKVPPPSKDSGELQTYFPKTKIDYVLEVASGYSEKVGIKEGDNITLPQKYQ
jgi:uncharacterized membrane protein (UPF0127 family)